MSLVVATRIVDGLKLEIDANSSLIVGSVASAQVQYREALFAYLLVSASPQVLKHSTIGVQVLKPFGIGLPPSDPMQYIRKLKLAADRTLETVTGERGLIASIRGLGYRLVGDWKLAFPRSRGQVDAAVNRLQQLARQCIALMKETPLVASDEGLLVLDATGRTSGADIRLQFEICIQELLHLASLNSNYSISEVDAQLLSDIQSYFSFARQGQVEEEVWRRLFEQELLHKMGVFVGRLYGIG